MTFLDYSLLFGFSIFAGILNTIAGGGALIGIPLLIFLGLPANVANATNRVGIFAQCFVATAQFSRHKILNVGYSLKLAIPACIGAAIGAYQAIDISKRTIGIVLLCVLSLMLINPRKWFNQAEIEDFPEIRIRDYVLFFLLGFYGGYVQAGVGLFIIITLVIFGKLDAIRANGVKVFLMFLFTIPSLAIFIYNDLVSWKPALALAGGSGIGAWLGSRLAVSWGPYIARIVLCVLVVAAAGYLFEVW